MWYALEHSASPLQPFLKVTTHRAQKDFGVNFQKALDGKGVFSYTSSQVYYSDFPRVMIVKVIDNYTMKMICTIFI